MADQVITQLTRERSELIDRLSMANRLLARMKGHLEADKLAAAAIGNPAFGETAEQRLQEINEFLAGGLFGDKGVSNGKRA